MFVDTEISSVNLRVLCNYQDCSMRGKINFKFIVNSLGRITSSGKCDVLSDGEIFSKG